MKIISASLIILLTITFAMPLVAAENEIGRYQAFNLPKQKESSSLGVFVLDTKEGHMWVYAIGTAPGMKRIFERIKYIGKVKPGQKAGEVIIDNSIKLD